MLYDFYFWDYDGTLFDSYPCIVRAYAKGLADLDIRLDSDELYSLTKVSLGHAAQVIGEEYKVPAQEIIARYRVYEHKEGWGASKPFEGTREMLQSVVDHGGRNFLYTHRDISGIEILKHFGLIHLFSDFITSEDNFPKKPHPDALLHLVSKHGLDKSRCIVETADDVLSGLNAGMSSALFDPEGICSPTRAAHRFASMHAARETLVER